MKKRCYYTLFPVFLLLLSPQLLVSQTAVTSEHRINAALENFEMDHQGGVEMLLEIGGVTGTEIGVPGSGELTLISQQELMDEATDFLENYPNTSDFFEIVNRNLNEHLRSEFPELEKLSVSFTIDPRPGVAFTVLSSTIFEDGALREFYGFDLPGTSTDHQDAGEIDLTVFFEYDQDLEPSDIPNVLFVRLNVINFINNYPNTTDYFEIYAKAMASSVLNGFDTINNVTISFEVPVRNDVPFVTFANTHYDRDDFTETYGFRAENDLGAYSASLDYVIGIEDEEYPNILDVEASFADFLESLDDEANHLQEFHSFNQELSASLSAVLRSSEISVGAPGQQDDEPEFTWISSSDGTSTQTGFQVDITVFPEGEGESLSMQPGFMLNQPEIDNPEGFASTVVSEALAIPYEGDITLFNYELKASLYSLLTVSPSGLSDMSAGSLFSSASWSGGGSFSKTASSDGELLTGTSVQEPGHHPETITLHQNYPNPFNPSTSISFSLENSGHVSLGVYDVLGRRVALLLNESLQSGEHQISFNARSLSSGVYFYRLESGGKALTRSMMLVK